MLNSRLRLLHMELWRMCEIATIIVKRTMRKNTNTDMEMDIGEGGIEKKITNSKIIGREGDLLMLEEKGFQIRGDNTAEATVVRGAACKQDTGDADRAL